jgi:predicted O-linked N-acetylglucosamine transferase (SPINDLY family)
MSSTDRTMSEKRAMVQALFDRSNALYAHGRLDEAMALCEQILSLDVRHAGALYTRGNIFMTAKHYREAAASYGQTLALQPGHVEAMNNRGCAMQRLGMFDAAIADLDRGLALRPDYASAWYNRGNVLLDMRRFADALASYDRVLALNPRHAGALNFRGGALQKLGRFEDALASYDRALALDPHHPYAFGGAAQAALKACDWQRTAQIAQQLPEKIAAGAAVIAPFVLLGYSGDPALQLQCARRTIADQIQEPPAPSNPGYRHDRLRIAYISSDFCQHPMPHLIVELIETHDRAQFEIIGISTGPDDGSAIRARIAKAFDQFHDVRAQDARTIAALLRMLEIDIAIDLNGHTDGNCFDVLSQRPCPIQVTYMGTPATLGADFIDYVIADPTVAPLRDQPFFAEKIVHLPDTYWVTDSRLDVSVPTPTRHQAGLPQNGFVFCCFNNSWKITSPLFDIWMRLLNEVPDSVLWLLEDNVAAARNLRREAGSRGVDSQQIIFAPRATMEAHLARHRLADLFLDTLPYNAHTTASDALRMGVPVITCRGTAFAGRVAASILQSLDMHDLVTGTLADYEKLALAIARDPQLLQSFNERIQNNRSVMPLFNTARFRRHLESAFHTMHEIHLRREAPRAIAVAPLP